MFWGYLIKIYLYFYSGCSFLWKLVCNKLGPFYRIYHIHNGQISNITPYYYLGYLPKKYEIGKYHCQVISHYRTDYFGYDGRLVDLFKIKLSDANTNLKRKNVMLFNENQIIDFDLNLLDNYVNNIHQIKKSQSLSRSELNPVAGCLRGQDFPLNVILSCFGISCSHVQFTTLIPFSKTKTPVGQLSVQDLYHAQMS